ncbi:MAG TPA: DUF423 domain-containing protein [Roseococcus sp.]|jgi:uncharacterized membrane protein YgdD (TMEM256/DUF423 family)|nr:DUF423 domain-containing protein [Roseococcus sp.]
MRKLWFSAAGLAGFAAVALAALGAHAPLDAREMVQSVAQILGWHAPALLAFGVWNDARGRAVAALMLPGLVLFSGAVLFRAFTGVSPGPIAPIGGFALMAGWLVLAALALRTPPRA